MKRKLHRSRNVFGKRGMPRGLKTLLWVVVCVAVVALGYFGAMLVSEGGLPQPDLQVGGDNTPDTPDAPNSDNNNNSNGDAPADPDQPAPPADTPALTERIRAFYLPVSDLSVDALSKASLLQDAAQAGFNAVVFDLKGADGTMHYRFNNAQAKKVNNYASNALTADGLTALFALMKENGLQPIPRLYAFCDDPAAKVLTDARIGLDSNHSWAWYDGDPNNGGKKWLNPYAAAAQDYISALVKELKDKGAAAVMLDGVQFPSQLKSAYLGEEAATVEKNAVLTAFVGRIRSELGAACPLLLGCSEKGALGTDTKIYGGNPLTFGASAAAPSLSGKVKESVEKMILRTQVLEDKPLLVPMLMTESASVKECCDAMAACVQGGAKDFILYSADGAYDFDAYTLP
ncbi:MAG: hypothetical protein IJN04_04715 [Clostridia bacterium]|nr:hypothetical protein [Clostridia bacterium]